uniref:Uncharacterized protein n=1 Tax=Octopus bimaculoides TaxID=37653 RepID=A0A0L8G1U7_OCTBM
MNGRGRSEGEERVSVEEGKLRNAVSYNNVRPFTPTTSLLLKKHIKKNPVFFLSWLFPVQ